VNVGRLDINTGSLAQGPAESYTIEGSFASARFTTPIQIDDNALVGVDVQVDLTAFSDLNLTVQNGFGPTVGTATLFVHAPGANFNLQQNSTAGSDTVTFGAPGTTSTIDFEADGGPVTVHNINIRPIPLS
jgi:hypothetical protein